MTIFMIKDSASLPDSPVSFFSFRVHFCASAKSLNSSGSGWPNLLVISGLPFGPFQAAEHRSVGVRHVASVELVFSPDAHIHVSGCPNLGKENVTM